MQEQIQKEQLKPYLPDPQTGWFDSLKQTDEQKKVAMANKLIQQQNAKIQQRNKFRELQAKKTSQLQQYQQNELFKKSVLQKQQRKRQAVERKAKQTQMQNKKMAQYQIQKQIQRKEDERRRQYKDDTFGYYKSKLNDTYNGSVVNRFVDTTFDTIDHYKKTGLNGIQAYLNGMERNARGSKQASEATNQFFNGNIGGYISNKASSVFNKALGDTQMDQGEGILASMSDTVAPLLLGGSAALYMYNNSKAAKLKKLYDDGGAANFIPLASKMIKQDVQDYGNSFKKRRGKFKNKNSRSLLKIGQQTLKNRLNERLYDGIDYGTQLLDQKFGNKKVKIQQNPKKQVQ